MNGTGVGLTVALGIGIAIRIAAPDLGVLEAVTSMAFYGLMTGFIVQVYQFALSGFRFPTRRR